MLLLRPTFYFSSVLEISIELLKSIYINGILLDVDGTISVQDSPNIDLKIMKWISKILHNDIKVLLFSNNLKNRVDLLAKKLNLSYIHHVMKPLPIKINRALNIIDCPKQNIIVIGDQILTDILLANIVGIKSILVDTINNCTHNKFSLRKHLEKRLRTKIKKF